MPALPAIALQFAGSGGFESAIIKWFSHGAPSHVDSVLPDGSLLGARSDVCKGVPAGVQIRPPDYYPFDLRIVVELPAAPEVVRAYYAFLLRQVGKPYDKIGLIANFLFDRDWREPDSWWCSELVARGLEPDISGYLPYPLATPAHKITPPDLLLICSTRVAISLPR